MEIILSLYAALLELMRKLLYLLSLVLMPLVGNIVLAQTDTDSRQKNWNRGPVELGNQYFIAVNHLSITPSSPEVAKKGTHQINALFSWTNSVSETEDVLFDAESRVVNLDYRYSLSDNWELGVDLPLIWRGGGVLDGFIDSWHEFFGFPEGDRNDVEDDQFNLIGRSDDGTVFANRDDGFGIGDISPSAKYLISSGSEYAPALSLKSKLRLPTGSSKYGGESVDLSLQLLASKGFGDFYIYGGVGYLLFLDDETKRIPFRTNNFHGSIHLEYQLFDSTSLLLGGNMLSHPLKDVRTQLSYQAYLDAAVVVDVSEVTRLEFMLRENLVSDDSSVDVSFVFGIRNRFGS